MRSPCCSNRAFTIIAMLWLRHRETVLMKLPLKEAITKLPMIIRYLFITTTILTGMTGCLEYYHLQNINRHHYENKSCFSLSIDHFFYAFPAFRMQAIRQ